MTRFLASDKSLYRRIFFCRRNFPPTKFLLIRYSMEIRLRLTIEFQPFHCVRSGRLHWFDRRIRSIEIVWCFVCSDQAEDKTTGKILCLKRRLRYIHMFFYKHNAYKHIQARILQKLRHRLTKHMPSLNFTVKVEIFARINFRARRKKIFRPY